jgi:hypothetical protein
VVLRKEEERRERKVREEELEVTSIGHTIISEHRCIALSKQRNMYSERMSSGASMAMFGKMVLPFGQCATVY